MDSKKMWILLAVFVFLASCIPATQQPYSPVEKPDQVLQSPNPVEIIEPTETIISVPTQIQSPTLNPLEIPAGEILWHEILPEKSPRAICPDVTTLHEQTLKEALNLQDTYSIFYSVEEEFTHLPTGTEAFFHSERRPCIRVDGTLPPGDHFIRYHVSIYQESSKYISPSTHYLVREIDRYLQITIKPPVSRYENLFAFTSIFTSEDGETLASGLLIADLEGKYLTELAHRVANPITNFAWAPDGQSIAFAADDGIFITNLRDMSTKELIRTDGLTLSPAWSPDGKYIAFINQDLTKKVVEQFGDLVIVDTKDGTFLTLTTEGVQAMVPVWSPDGKRLAFTSGSLENTNSSFMAVSQVGIINSDGSDYHEIAEADSLSSNPTWSPDNKQLAFVRNGDLYVSGFDGQNLRNLTNTQDVVYAPPAWKPDGSAIAFICFKDLVYSIKTFDKPTGSVMELQSFPNRQYVKNISWIDSQKMYIYESYLRVYLVSPDGSKILPVVEGENPAPQP